METNYGRGKNPGRGFFTVGGGFLVGGGGVFIARMPEVLRSGLLVS
jgi:hypothetical protein